MTEPRIELAGLDEAGLDAGSRSRIEAGVRATLATGPAAGKRRAKPSARSSGPPTAEVSVTAVPAAEIRRLNREYHGVDAETDVLAFDLGPAGDVDLLGDIYICPEVAYRRAEAHGASPADEIVRLAIHGTLHLLGHDHPEDERRDASPMFELQERLVEETRRL